MCIYMYMYMYILCILPCHCLLKCGWLGSYFSVRVQIPWKFLLCHGNHCTMLRNNAHLLMWCISCLPLGTVYWWDWQLLSRIWIHTYSSDVDVQCTYMYDVHRVYCVIGFCCKCCTCTCMCMCIITHACTHTRTHTHTHTQHTHTHTHRLQSPQRE